MLTRDGLAHLVGPLIVAPMILWAARAHHARSESAKRAFWRLSGHPHGWAGHVVDHIVPLARGGCDCPPNMQWMTTAEAKAKDRWELKADTAWTRRHPRGT